VLIRIPRRPPTWTLAVLIAAAAACQATPQNGPADPVVLPSTVDHAAPETLTLPDRRTSVKFAVIGDSGRGTPEQFAVAAQMVRYREAFPYAFVIMLGDNIYEGPASPDDYRRKFEEPYRELLDRHVPFYAVLGNHDDPDEINYAPFNMHGERYYTFSPPEDLATKLATSVEFFALDSTNLDAPQLAWLDERLGRSKADWKIVYMHHPLYTSGRYRETARIHRWRLEPILTKHHVDAFFSGHEHIYQRSRVENGIQYFISGGAGSLRRGDGAPASYIAKTFAGDFHFMLVEIDDKALHFQAISRTGVTIDAGSLYRRAEDAHRSVGAATAADTADRR